MELAIKNIDKNQIQSSQDTFEIIQKIFFKRRKKVDLLKEHFWTIALNRASKILLIELVSIGSNGKTIAAPQEIFRLPLYKAASHLVLIHNHPSGGLKPSQDDLDITNRLIQTGDMMDIEIVDHVIVTQNSYYSFCDNGLIEKLRWDRKYALTFIRDKQVAEEIAKIKKDAEKHQQLIRKEGEKVGEERGEKKGAKEEKIQIARQMLKEKEDLDKIKKYTGLSSQWLGRLKAKIENEATQ